ncbi:MAG: plasmid stabilization system [Pseudarcicella sp.]|nr:plasmid stabilization system [Pseudarcicella sp.]MBP6411155.1 plasmid stabilization system [Pseudarcicella sp.]
MWHKEQKEGLEVEFANAIENTIERIVDSPQIFPIRYKNNRIAHPKIFPYNIHFYIDEPNTSVVITAIVHSKRHPKIAKRRI